MTATDRPASTFAEAESPEGMALLSNCLLRHFDRILLIVEYRASRPLRERSSVEDLAHEVVVEALRRQTQFEYRGENEFVRWISTLARRVVSDAARCTRREPTTIRIGKDNSTGPHISPSHIPGSMRTPSSIVALGERFDLLRSALGRLSESDRTIISLIHLEGYSVDEAAVQMSCSTEIAARRLSRALGRLGRELRPQCGDENVR